MEFKQENTVTLLVMEGNVTFEDSNRTKQEAKDYLNREEVEKLVVDLSRVEFMDSSGVGVLISLFKNMRERGGKMVLASPTEKVKRVFELTMLGKIITIFNSLEEAIESLSDN